jgi:general secretion pathway protein E
LGIVDVDSADLAGFRRFLGFDIPASVAAEREPAASSGADASIRGLSQLVDLDPSEFADRISKYFGIERVLLPELLESAALSNGFSPRFLRHSAVFPYRSRTGEPQLAIADPTDEASIRAAEIVLGARVGIRIASFEDLSLLFDKRIGPEESESSEGGDPDAESVEALRDLASGARVVHALNELLEAAVQARASDVHLESSRTGLVARFRVDGLLRTAPLPAGAPPQALISRIKILAGLNIAERRLPQDGAARLKLERVELDARVATMPTHHGEGVVIRLLVKDKSLLRVERLGFASEDRAKIDAALQLPHGMVIVTGPTGSGKTTTLAAMLAALNVSSRKILTIEDPIEYEIPGISQSQTNPSIGLTFASALRSFVRQDPDVIMVGEIRDSETARIAVHAALTGHLVLTSLHTESAAAAIPRLVDLGVEPFLLRSTLRYVIGQRLVRQLCSRCRRQFAYTAVGAAADPRFGTLGLRSGEVLYEAKGCDHCGGNGYRGRLGIFEVLRLTNDTTRAIGSHSDASSIALHARGEGMTTMLQDGVRKCREGLTSPLEVLRVAANG